MKKFTFAMLGVTALIALSACEKETTDLGDEVNVKECAYILNQGNMYKGIGGSLNILNYEDNKMIVSAFEAANGRSIGDTPQCGVAYDDKVYVGTMGSNTIEIFEAETALSIKHIELGKNGENGVMPRSMVAYDGNIYIAMYDGYVARLNTKTLEIDGTVKVGANPDVMCLHNDKLYVPNTNGANYPNYDNTISVIDIKTFKVVETMTVGLNPTHVYSVGGKLFALCMGNYADTPAQLYDITNGSVAICNATLVGASDKELYIFDDPYYGYGNPPTYRVYDVATSTLSDWNIERPEYPQNIAWDKSRNQLIIASYHIDPATGYPQYDAEGYVAVYDKSYKISGSYAIGTGPATIFFREK